MHNIKGSSKSAGMLPINQLAHDIEGVFEEFIKLMNEVHLK